MKESFKRLVMAWHYQTRSWTAEVYRMLADLGIARCGWEVAHDAALELAAVGIATDLPRWIKERAT